MSDVSHDGGGGDRVVHSDMVHRSSGDNVQAHGGVYSAVGPREPGSATAC